MKRPIVLATFVTLLAHLPVSELTDSTTSITGTDASSYWFIGGSGGDAYDNWRLGKTNGNGTD